MDCNKEEAMRAKVMAEKKMESKDFVAAHKMALRVKKLYPDTENISQMLLICDVHCASTKKLLGGDMDWYGILQVERTADEAVIRKQYRKFALLLHPDKNKLSGAEGAFKLVGEAHRFLLDQEKRRLYDMKNGHASLRPQHYTTVVPNTVGTFWTMCNFCQVRYQYHKEVLNRSIRCQKCANPFVAFDMTRVSATNFSKPVFPQQQMNNTCKTEAHPNRVFGTATSSAKPAQKKGKHVDSTNPRANTGKMNHKTTKKRTRVHIDLSESEISDSSSDSEEGIESADEDVQAEKNSRNREENVRRSSRHKQKVSYKENKSDDDVDEAVGDDDNGDVDLDVDDDRASKRAKGKSSSGSSKEENGDKSKDDEEIEVSDEEECLPNGHKTTRKSFVIDTDSGSEKDVLDPLVSYPDPEFSNFEEDRKPECFSEGQIWACYDDKGALPRFYASIKKVFSPRFKLEIRWLEPEPDPDDENEKLWLSKNMPISCGKFRLQKTEETNHLPMFSHVMTCHGGFDVDNTTAIYPKKAEIWAVFKNWDMKWSRDPVAKRQFEYDFVVVITNYFQGTGIYVGLLTKVKGFVSLFCQTENIKEMFIPANEVFRFSHMVPSRKINADERVPRDSFELDPAALPLEFFGSRQKGVNGNSESNYVQVSSSESSDVPESEESESLEVPEPDFFNFVANKSKEKFQIGQIWALYSDEDEMPKYYAQIKKLKLSPGFSVHISWLNPSRSADCIGWNDKDMLVGCGTFHCPKIRSIAYESLDSFSHQVKVIKTSHKKKEFKIHPNEGEVWALYRNWKADLKLSDLKNCEYDIVEILGDQDSKIEVVVLERVPNYNSVFKLQTQGISSVTKKVSHLELVKFSHQIPAFRLTDEKGGALWGCWELDPAALPVNILRKN